MSNFYETVKSDFKVNKNSKKSILIIVLFRITNYLLLRSKHNIFFKILYVIMSIIYKIIVQFIFNIEIPSKVKIGKGFQIIHGQGIVINGDSEIGEFFTIKHNVTIGCKIDFENNTCIKNTVIGNNCIISPGAVLIGVVLANNIIVGANSVVTKDFLESNMIIAGNPARKIK